MPITSDEFRRALGQFASGVTAVTTRDGQGRPLGLTVSAFCSVSLQPPLVLVCVDRTSEAHGAFRESGLFGVSVLSEGQEEISRRFAWPGDTKFDAGLIPGRTGVPLVKDALVHLECRLSAAHEAGDHTVFVGEILETAVRAGRPLLYHRGLYRRLDADPGEPT
jgi:flavin reductase (DIM6/NTAB) family NADH-FMN oxidoreductase RutF